MRELQEKIVDPKEVDAVKPIKREVRFKTLRPQPGQHVWQMDLTTRIIEKAQYEENSVDFVAASKGDFSVHRKVKVKENHLYVCAINAQNADKKFLKLLGLKQLPGTKLKTV